MNRILFALGFLLMLLPFGFQMFDKQQQENIVATYWKDVEALDETEVEACLQEAETYNIKLYRASEVLEESYVNLLNLSGNGMMGSIEIPKISLNLPIYHGTEEEVLSIGIGHLEGSSLPVGGSNTHSVLTGHRGVPNAQLFTRLDELEKGDVFYVRTCNQVLIYQISKIQVVEPEEIEAVDIQAEKDLVSLVTCTPYGLNTHRLIVTGERVQENAVTESAEQAKSVSKRDLIFIIIPFLFLIFAVIKGKKSKKRHLKKKKFLGILALLFIMAPLNMHAAEGSVEIVLPNESTGTVLYSKVADLEDGQYILKEEYSRSQINLNQIQTAAELEQTSKDLEKYRAEYTKVSFQGKSRMRILGLEEGAYLFCFEGDENIDPTLVFVPMWEETEEKMTYDITIIPKCGENPPTPDTGWNDFLGWYLLLFMISLIIIVRLSCHNRFKCGRIALKYSEMGGYTYGNDNDTKNPRCPRRIGFSGCRSIDRS